MASPFVYPTVRAVHCYVSSYAGRLADTDPVTGHNEARLLLFGVDWCVWIADATATVCAERRRSTSVLGEEIRTHNSTSPRTSLAESPGEDLIPVVCSDSSVSACIRHRLRLTKYSRSGDLLYLALTRRDTSVDN